MLMSRKTIGVIGLGLAAWLMAALPASGQQPSKGTEEQIAKARDEVRKLTADLDKLNDQVYEAQRRLTQAYDRLDELEGRRPDRRFGRGGFGPFGGGNWQDFIRRPEPPRTAPPATPPPATAGDLEKRLEKLIREIEELRREIRRP